MGSARPVRFEGGSDMELHGYWLPEDKQALVEVPIFQHAFYPTHAHTDLDVRQNVTYRSVTIPSLSTLRAHGIEAERAVFVAEVVVHPRYIKHNNYFRGDFPATIKTLARRENIVFLFPASDMPSARLKRKQVLNFWRLSFSPLLLKGRQYTSGRMGFFMVAPPGSATKFKKSLNLEDISKSVKNILEWHPAVNTTRRPRKRGPRPKYTAEERRMANELVKETSDKLSDQLLPLVTSKLDIDPHSTTAQKLDAYFSNPTTSRELIKATEGKPNRVFAVKNWVRNSLIPHIKEIAKEEIAVQGENILRFGIITMLTIAVDIILGEAQASRFGKKINALQKLEYKPSSMASSTQVGAGSMVYKFSPNSRDLSTMQNKIAEFVVGKIMEAVNDWRPANVIQKSLFDITLNPNNKTKPITVKLDRNALKTHREHNSEGLGPFADGNKDGYLVGTILPHVEREANTWYLQGMETESSYASSLFGY